MPKLASLELFYPTDSYFVGQKFGQCSPAVCAKYKEFGLKAHNGEDLHAPDGAIVRAAHDGVVTFAGEDGAGGLIVVIRTLDKRVYGLNGAYFKSIYCHLKKNSFRVKASQKVKVGDIIALADNTGFSSGSHLHFGLKPVRPGEQDWVWDNVEQDNGYRGAIDPAPYWNKIHAKDAQTVLQKLQSALYILQSYLNTKG